MKRRVFAVGMVATLAVSGCATSKFQRYYGPKVTSVFVDKGERRLYLLHNSQVLKQYRFDLGFAPVGDKKIEGDGKTPEGLYTINRRNPNSSYHLSLGISYPDANDVAEAKALGEKPGGEIFIHGQPNLLRAKGSDWTAGCIAIKNREIEEMYAMVDDGTVISLRA